MERTLGLASKVVGLLALATLAAEYGFYTKPLSPGWLHGLQIAAVVAYLLLQALDIALATRRREALLRHRLDFGLILIGAFALLVAHRRGGSRLLTASAVYVGVLQALISFRIGVAALRFDMAWTQRKLAPARLLMFGFLSVIVTGGTLLWALPRACSPELAQQTGMHFAKHVLNCYFTAVSATCVTGLTVYDSQKDFTLFGQSVILGMIQVGGLGIMIFGSFFGLLARRQFSLRESLALQDALSQDTVGEVRKMVRFVVISTLLIEAVGAAVLYPMWPTSVGGPAMRVFYSTFHAVSAFCNAGFALHADNLMPYRQCWQVYASIMPLIVIGGLGFPVLADLTAYARSIVVRPAPRGVVEQRVHSRMRRWRPTVKVGWIQWRRDRTLSLHTKAALVTTVILIGGGALGLFVLESIEWRGREQLAKLKAQSELGQLPPAMIDQPLSERAAAALFQSVTTRTAGFNTVAMDVGSMSCASHFLMGILMFIGGSPASTAGGIKTVTAFLIWMAAMATLRGRETVEAFNRTVPIITVRRAGVVLLCMLVLVGVCTLLLCATERTSLQEISFEVISAAGTVGLSTGLTVRLTEAGKIIIMLAMFAGRLGPLTLLAAVAGGDGASPKYNYPREQVLVG